MVRLETSQPSQDTQHRVTRMMQDVIALKDLSRAEIRSVYGHLEAVRDALSLMLDKADNKDA